ncbi:glycosyltransferase [Streptomyces olivochromogenes]|uniref:glycosyltransferase n=1 Tax=Streptomyces olivochromogenes TaxID=1963 RepID=UPI001F1F225F|nr:glycosyltransferase [Streptomyces olivochromogenes]
MKFSTGARVTDAQQVVARVWAVVVHHNSLGTLKATAHNLLDEGIDPKQVVVVDNSMHRVSEPELARAVPPGVHLLRVENQGYGAAVNAGFRLVDQFAAGCAEAVLVVTHEVLFSQGAVAVLVETVRGAPSVGAVAPLLTVRGASGEEVWSSGGYLTGCFRLPRHRTELEVGRDCATVEWADGAAVMYRPSALRLGMDERYFLYMEEVELHLRLRASGMRVVVAYGARASQSTGGMPPYYAVRNIQLLHRRFGRRGFRHLALASVTARAVAKAAMHSDLTAFRAVLRGVRDGRRARLV